MIEKKIFSNLIVKSKSPRQPRTAGPNEASSGHPEKSIAVCTACAQFARAWFLWAENVKPQWWTGLGLYVTRDVGVFVAQHRLNRDPVVGSSYGVSRDVRMHDDGKEFVSCLESTASVSNVQRQEEKRRTYSGRSIYSVNHQFGRRRLQIKPESVKGVSRVIVRFVTGR